MAQERLTKDQKREQAREAARIAREERLKAERRKKILIPVVATVGALALVAAIGGGIWLANRPAGPGPVNMASDGIVLTGSGGEVSAVLTGAVPADGEPVATNPDTLDAPAHIVAYVDFACPHCQDFEATNAAQLKTMVGQGLATFEVHPISIMQSPYSALAANAAACVAATSPDSFLDALESLMANGASGNTDRASIRSSLEGVGVLNDEISSCIGDGRYNGWVESATARALADESLRDAAGSFGTPRILVNGDIYTGPNNNAPAFAAFLQPYFLATDDDPSTDPTPEPDPAP